MIALRRTDTSVLGRWWWTVDRWSLLAVALLAAAGALLILAASPPVAHRLGFDTFHFVHRQIAFAAPALVVMLAVSLLNPVGVRRLGLVAFAAAVLLLLVTALLGSDINGARRWLKLGGIVVQPSEFAKPTFIVVSAWILARDGATPRVSTIALSALCLAGLLGLLVIQPDFGMAVVVSLVWLAQVFVAGLSYVWIAVAAAAGVAGLFAAYAVLPHVASRIDRFLDPSTGDSYQVETARHAFLNGGLFGRGPGEGVMKNVLPDAHTDFIFAVAGEEFGLITCLFLVGLFALFVMRGFSRVLQSSDRFVQVAATGLIVQFALQAVINIGVNLHLMPTKGMTLPFISYGGSSLFGLALLVGTTLALTRQRAEFDVVNGAWQRDLADVRRSSRMWAGRRT